MFCFYAETEQGVAQAIIRSVLDFKRDPWPKVSENAKDLVKKMLDPDPKRRLSAQEVLGNLLFFKMVTFFASIALQNESILKFSGLIYLMQSLYFVYSLIADHPWLQNAKKAPNVSLGETVRARLKQFSMMNKLKKRALRVML